MTPRNWKLYSLIKEATAKEQVLTVKDVCDALPEYFKLNAKESNFSNCPALYEAIDEINESCDVEHIITKDNNRFKLGTLKECEEYKDKMYARAVKMLAKYYKIVKKMEHHNQYKLLSSKNVPIDDESEAKKYVDAFIHCTRPIELWNFQEQKLYYKKLCYETGNAPLNLGQDDLLKEIRSMEKYYNDTKSIR